MYIKLSEIKEITILDKTCILWSAALCPVPVHPKLMHNKIIIIILFISLLSEPFSDRLHQVLR
jgi:hypothetical protein